MGSKKSKKRAVRRKINYPTSVTMFFIIGCLISYLSYRFTENLPYHCFGNIIDEGFLDSLKWFSFLQPMTLFIGLPVSLAPFAIYRVRLESKRVQIIALVWAVLVILGFGAFGIYGVKVSGDYYTVEKYIVTDKDHISQHHSRGTFKIYLDNGKMQSVSPHVYALFDEGDEAYVVSAGEYGVIGLFPVSEYTLGEGVSVS